MTRYAAPGTEGAIVSYQARYDHFIGGEYVPPARGQYFENPIPGQRAAVHRDRARHRGGRGAGAGRRARGRPGLGPHLGDRARPTSC